MITDRRQLALFDLGHRQKTIGRMYSDRLSASVNSKGVLDVDTVKGCPAGMARPDGCYSACYAASIARFRGLDFSVAVVRTVQSESHRRSIERAVALAPLGFFRVGTMGDPSLAWEHTVSVVEWLSQFARPVVVTKHWNKATDHQLARLIKCGAALNTSISALDSGAELYHHLDQFWRFSEMGGNSIARIVSCEFNEENPEGARMAAIQERLFKLSPIIDNPLRAPKNHPLVVGGIIRLTKTLDLKAERTISLNNKDAYVGHCDGCLDVCGLSLIRKESTWSKQYSLFA